MDLETRLARLERRMRWWPISVGIALAVGVSIGSRATADAPPKQVVLTDGDRKVTLEPAGLRFEGPDGNASLGPDRLTIASAKGRSALIAVDDQNAAVSFVVANDANHRVRAVATSAASEVSVESDRTKVDLHAANDARASATGGGADAELSIDNGVPCWMLAPAVAGKAQRTCNTAK
jgi:hypothetical protein